MSCQPLLRPPQQSPHSPPMTACQRLHSSGLLQDSLPVALDLDRLHHSGSC